MNNILTTNQNAKNIVIGLPEYIDSNEKNADKKFGKSLYKHLKDFDGQYDEIVILCIGTDRATGDSLGPLTGYILDGRMKKKSKNIILYGTLEKPVHAKNISEVVRLIYSVHENPLIVAIDACLGKASHIGYVQFGKGSVSPGAGVNKKLQSVGDIFVIGVVNFSGSMEIAVLQNTRLHIVMTMAHVISNGIYKGLEALRKEKESIK